MTAALLQTGAPHPLRISHFLRSTADIEQLARLLDDRFVLPGLKIRLGYDALLGLVPGIGDALSALLGGYLIARACMLGAPVPVLARMGVNLALDAALGLVPVVGDIADIAFRSNVANIRLLQAHLQKTGSRRSHTAPAL